MAVYILKRPKKFDIELFLRNSLFTVNLIIILGYLGAHNPIVKFLIFIFLANKNMVSMRKIYLHLTSGVKKLHGEDFIQVLNQLVNFMD